MMGLSHISQISFILPFSKAVSVYNIVLVISNTAPTTPEPTDIIIRLVDTYSVLENRSSAVLVNTAAIISKMTPGIPYDASGWRNEINCIRVNTNPLLVVPFSRAVSVYNIVLVTSNTAPTTPEPTDIIIRLVDTYSVLENRSSAVLVN